MNLSAFFIWSKLSTTKRSVSVEFAEAVDIQISAANIPDSQKSIWNSEGDFGDFSITEGSRPEVHDPNEEIEITPLSKNSFSWKFSKPNDDKFISPSLSRHGESSSKAFGNLSSRRMRRRRGGLASISR